MKLEQGLDGPEKEGTRLARVWTSMEEKGASKGRSTIFPSRAAFVLELRCAGVVFGAWP